MSRQHDEPVELGSPEFWARLQADPAALAAQVCSIDLRNLDDTLVSHPALRAWLNATHEVAKIEEEKAQWELTKARAEVMLRAKADEDAEPAETDSKGKPKAAKKAKTVDVLKAEVEVHPDVINATHFYHAALEKRSMLSAMTKALDDRLQMLIQVSANQRAERENYSRQ